MTFSQQRMRLAAVSYVNTLPFLQGISSDVTLSSQCEVITAAPSRCAALFRDGEVDAALVPVGALPTLSDYRIITDYGILSRGSVETVIISAERPIDQLQTIILDPDSRTSAALVKALVRQYWKLPIDVVAGDVRQTPTNASTGRLLIGDKARQHYLTASYVYDLGELWQQWTGYPMVYAVWIANDRVAAEFEVRLSSAFERGCVARDEIDLSHMTEPAYWRHYLLQVIHYDIDEQARMGLQLYLDKITAHE